jgi:hypothetical protein
MPKITKLKSMRGMGDVVDAITTVTGVKKVVKAVSNAVGKDCGCGDRKDSLNRKFPFNKE